MSITLDTDSDTQFLDLNSRSMLIPPTGSSGPTLGIDMIMNRSKISKDVLSIHSGSGGSESSYTETSEEYDDDSGASGNDDSRQPSGGGGGGGNNGGGGGGDSFYKPAQADQGEYRSRIVAEHARQEELLTEKRDIIYKMDRLEARGFNVPRKFTMASDLEDMRSEYQRILREKEIEGSIRLQQKMLIAFVTGVEILNTRFDPFSVELDGFSEAVNDSINDYDDIFEELHDKYKGTSKKMAPELRLMMGISGAAFQHHLTKSIFKKSKVPNVEEVLRSDPELMKRFQSAAANRVNSGGGMGGMGGGGGGLFGMLGNMFGGGGAPKAQPPRQQAPPQQYQPGRQQAPPSHPPFRSQHRMSDPGDIDDIIQEVHRDIETTPPPNNSASRYDSLSVTDEEIMSIIEDTTDDIIIGGGGGKRAPSRRQAPNTPHPRKQGGAPRRTLDL
jgi:hypothetical protein